MKKAGIAELNARLSSYLEQVKSGSELLVTDRRVPIARLVPLAPGEKRASRLRAIGFDGYLCVVAV